MEKRKPATNEKRAEKELKSLAEALSHGAEALKKLRICESNVQKLQSEISKREEKIRDLKKRVREKEKLLKVYERFFGKAFKICDACGGQGGDIYVDEYGYVADEWVCDKCDGYGVVTADGKAITTLSKKE